MSGEIRTHDGQEATFNNTIRTKNEAVNGHAIDLASLAPAQAPEAAHNTKPGSFPPLDTYNFDKLHEPPPENMPNALDKAYQEVQAEQERAQQTREIESALASRVDQAPRQAYQPPEAVKSLDNLNKWAKHQVFPAGQEVMFFTGHHEHATTATVTGSSLQEVRQPDGSMLPTVMVSIKYEHPTPQKRYIYGNESEDKYGVAQIPADRLALMQVSDKRMAEIQHDDILDNIKKL